MVVGPLGLAPSSWSKFSTVNQRSCDYCFRKDAGVSTTTTSELALLRGYHPRKFVSDGTARPLSGLYRVLLAAEHG
jgi:hypothetical protein